MFPTIVFLLFSTVNPCCYLPCQHRGVCVRYGENSYECDCTRTGYYGQNCTIRESLNVSFISSRELLLLKEFEVFFLFIGWEGLDSSLMENKKTKLVLIRLGNKASSRQEIPRLLSRLNYQGGNGGRGDGRRKAVFQLLPPLHSLLSEPSAQCASQLHSDQQPSVTVVSNQM